MELVGLLVESNGPAAAIGDFCEMTRSGRVIRTQVIGFRDGRVLSMPLEETDGLQLGDLLRRAKRTPGWQWARNCSAGCWMVSASRWRAGPIEATTPYDLYAAAPGPLDREPIGQPMVTGIRAIDSLLTCGKGQRIGIFGGSGVGKSTLLGAMSRNNSAEVSVIALIGERNREVRDSSITSWVRRNEAIGGGGRDFRPSRAAAHSRGVRCAGGRRIFPRPGRQTFCW